MSDYYPCAACRCFHLYGLSCEDLPSKWTPEELAPYGDMLLVPFRVPAAWYTLYLAATEQHAQEYVDKWAAERGR